MICATCHQPSPSRIRCACDLLHCGECYAAHKCPEKLVLRAHQAHGNTLTFDEFRRQMRKVLRVEPTGSGKRYEEVWLAKKAVDQGKKTLVVTDRRILVGQMKDELERFGVPYGVIMGDIAEDRSKPVQVMSIHTYKRRISDARWLLPEADMILVDEAHKEPAAYAQLFYAYPSALIVGFTATPLGPKGTTLIGEDLYQSQVEPVRNSELIHAGLLLPTVVWGPSEPHLCKLRAGSKSGEFNQVELGRQVQSCTTFANIFDAWAAFIDRQTICFAPGLAYGRDLERQFRENGYAAAMIDGDTKPEDRVKILKRFSQRETRVLISVDVLREGFDAPIASCIIDLQPNKQIRTAWQKWGRIKRPYKGQKDAVLLDLAGNCWRFPHPDDDPPWREVASNRPMAEVLKTWFEKNKEKKPIRCPKCSHVRKGGATCPECGYQCQKRVRRVRMGDGKIRNITIKERQHHERAEADKVLKEWKSELYAGMHTNRSLKACRFFFSKRHGRWPPNGLPGMPPFGSVQWSYKVKDLYKPADIERMFENTR